MNWREMLSMHEFGEPVTWPPHFSVEDARSLARQGFSSSSSSGSPPAAEQVPVATSVSHTVVAPLEPQIADHWTSEDFLASLMANLEERRQERRNNDVE